MKTIQSNKLFGVFLAILGVMCAPLSGAAKSSTEITRLRPSRDEIALNSLMLKSLENTKLPPCLLPMITDYYGKPTDKEGFVDLMARMIEEHDFAGVAASLATAEKLGIPLAKLSCFRVEIYKPKTYFKPEERHTIHVTLARYLQEKIKSALEQGKLIDADQLYAGLRILGFNAKKIITLHPLSSAEPKTKLRRDEGSYDLPDDDDDREYVNRTVPFHRLAESSLVYCLLNEQQHKAFRAVRWLLKNGAYSNQDLYKILRHILHHSIGDDGDKTGNFIELLLKHAPLMLYENPKNISCLQLAITEGDEEENYACAKVLLEHGAAVNGTSLVKIPRWFYGEDYGDEVFSHKPPVFESVEDFRDFLEDNEITPLHYAIANGHDSVIELLLGFGADPLFACGGYTAWDWADDETRKIMQPYLKFKGYTREQLAEKWQRVQEQSKHIDELVKKEQKWAAFFAYTLEKSQISTYFELTKKLISLPVSITEKIDVINRFNQYLAQRWQFSKEVLGKKYMEVYADLMTEVMTQAINDPSLLTINDLANFTKVIRAGIIEDEVRQELWCLAMYKTAALKEKFGIHWIYFILTLKDPQALNKLHEQQTVESQESTVPSPTL
jgi:hypothetical protein